MPLIEDESPPAAPPSAPTPTELFPLPAAVAPLCARLVAEVVEWLGQRPAVLAVAGRVPVGVPLVEMASWPHALAAPEGQFLALLLELRRGLLAREWRAEWEGPRVWPHTPPAQQGAMWMRVDEGWMSAPCFLALPASLQRAVVGRDDVRAEALRALRTSDPPTDPDPTAWVVYVTPA